jgi:hypothetical protein
MIFVRCWIADKAFADGSHCTRRSRWPSLHPREQLGCLFVGEYVVPRLSYYCLHLSFTISTTVSVSATWYSQKSFVDNKEGSRHA